MNWDAFGAIGEMFGAIAVVGTLLYLSIQVRHSKTAVEENTRTARISVLDQHTQAQSRWREGISGNEGLATIWVKAASGTISLNQVEKERFRQCARDFFNVWRSGFAAALSVEDEGQSEHLVRSCAQTLGRHKGLMEMWESGGRMYSELVIPEFVTAVEKKLGEKDGGT